MKAKILAALTIAFWFGFQTCAYAFDVTITSTFDKTNANSLRGAILRANKFSGINTISLTRGAYRLINEDSINVGDLDITNGNLIIVGRHGSHVTIDASDQSLLGNRVFHIWPGAHLTLVNLVITGGRELFGGGIWNEGTLTLDNCIITGNFSESGDGGGIYNTSMLTVNNSVISNNLAAAGNNNFDFGTGGVIIITAPVPEPGGNGDNGGGIYNSGNLTMNNSAVSGNSAGAGQDGVPGGNGGSGGSGGSGGGIYNAGNLTLSHCTVNDNSSGAAGNGISGIPAGNGGNGGSGGGIFNSGNASNAKLIHTSVISNFAGQGGMVVFTGIGDGSPGLDGSGPNLFGDFTISQ
jgi:hypothetical protein